MPSSIASKQKMIELKRRQDKPILVEDIVQYMNPKRLVLGGKPYKFDRVFTHTDTHSEVYQEVEEVI